MIVVAICYCLSLFCLLKLCVNMKTRLEGESIRVSAFSGQCYVVSFRLPDFVAVSEPK